MSKVKEAMETYEIVLESMSLSGAKILLDWEGFVVVKESNEIRYNDDERQLASVTVLGLIDPKTIFEELEFWRITEDGITIYFW